MTKNELIQCFFDTVNISNHLLKTETEKAIQSNRIYKKGFIADKRNNSQAADIIVEANTSFKAAKEYLQYGKVAVLNFANPHNPGGGVHNGAMAQEECLCRSSNLYPCISNQNVFNDYYLYHKDMAHYFFSDRLIYTKDITIFKDDSDVPQIMPKEEWFNVDVITCAAPYIAKRKYTNKTALKELFKGRIKNIFEAAIGNDIAVIILGAFGCGAFKNPPEVVAEAFHEVIDENNYKDYFSKIVFAIKSTVNDDPFTACPNIMTFEMEFYGVSSELAKERFSGGTPVAYAYGDAVMPSGRIHKTGIEFLKYYEWKNANKYFGKQFSVLGDSISTLEGYNPKGCKLFFSGDNCEKSGVKEMKDTWWGKVVDFFGGELLVNNSWSGSRVTKLPQNDDLFPSGCSDERTGELHINNVMPDVIIVYLGTNDWAFGARRNDETHLLVDEMEYFESAYDAMLKKLKNNYPNSEIWCCTLCSTKMSTNPSFLFPENYNGNDVNYYNNAICESAWKNNCKLIDLYSYHMPYDSIDGSHPNADGMNTLATMMIRSIGGKDIEQFMDCESGKHQFSFMTYEYDQSYRGGYHVCEKCGKFQYEQEQIYKKSDEISVGTVIDGKYELISQVGQGAFTEAYLAKNRRLNKMWAAKICEKDNSSVINAMINEINMVKNLNHNAIPHIVDIIDNQGYLCIIEDYIEGATFEDIVRNYGAQPQDNVVEWAKQLCDVVGYLHSQNPPLIHRDIKPKNIILKPDGNIVLIDFGIMRTYKPNNLADTVALGTKGYAAPEQYGARQTDARTDIFGLGMTIHHLLTGVEPTENNGCTLPICQINSELSKGLEYIVNKCIEPNPGKRYQSCSELLNDLNRYKQLPPKKNLFSKILGKK